MGKKSVLVSKPAYEHHVVPRITMDKFGKDHWSMLGYAECRIVDNRGIPDRRHMRCNPKRHPQFAHISWDKGDAKERYATRLKNNVLVPYHDDWDCVEDLVSEGLLKDLGTGINPYWELTDKGKIVAAALRKHKAEGGMFATFSFSG